MRSIAPIALATLVLGTSCGTAGREVVVYRSVDQVMPEYRLAGLSSRDSATIEPWE
jgi:hypothetical protein